MKIKALILSLFIPTSLIAGGAGSGGAPPPLAVFEDEQALDSVSEIEVSELALKNAMIDAVENNKVDIKVGKNIINLKPTNLDITEKTLSIKNPATGLDIIVRKSPISKPIVVPPKRVDID